MRCVFLGIVAGLKKFEVVLCWLCYNETFISLKSGIRLSKIWWLKGVIGCWFSKHVLGLFGHAEMKLLWVTLWLLKNKLLCVCLSLFLTSVLLFLLE